MELWICITGPRPSKTGRAGAQGTPYTGLTGTRLSTLRFNPAQ